MKARKSLIVVAVLAADPLVAWVALRPSVPVIDPLAADRLVTAADQWCEQFPDQDIPSANWPEEVQQLRPQSVRVTPDGVYVERGAFFVEEWGVFIHRTGSTLRPSADTDPSIRPLQGRVYWYRIKG